MWLPKIGRRLEICQALRTFLRKPPQIWRVGTMSTFLIVHHIPLPWRFLKKCPLKEIHMMGTAYHRSGVGMKSHMWHRRKVSDHRESWPLTWPIDGHQPRSEVWQLLFHMQRFCKWLILIDGSNHRNINIKPSQTIINIVSHRPSELINVSKSFCWPLLIVAGPNKHISEQRQQVL